MKSIRRRSPDDRRKNDGPEPAPTKPAHKRLAMISLMAAAVAMALVFAPSGASAGHVPPLSVSIADSGGVNDEDPADTGSQTDLAGVTVGPHGEFGFAWDETDAGGGSSDTCTYYLEPDDTVTAVCYSVDKDGVATTTVYDCGVGYTNGKCSGNVPVSQEYSADCSDPVEVDPYFADDPDDDLQVFCQLNSLDGSDVDSLKLINTCSKPSQSPSSVSKDCIFSGNVVFISLTKSVDGGTADAADWTLSATGPLPELDDDPLPQTISADGHLPLVALAEGTYTLAELGTTAMTADYELESIVCSTDGGDPVDVTEAGEIALAGNFTATSCTFTNVLKPGEIVVEKVTVPDTDTDTDFTFNADYLVDPAVINSGGSFSSGEIAPGNYSVTEVAVPGWVQTSAVCGSDIDVDDTSELDAIDLDPGETITCVVTNTQLAGAQVTKSGAVDATETWSWTLDKGIDLDGADGIDTDDAEDSVELTIAQGESVTGNYTVSVDGSSETTGVVDWVIAVENPRSGDMVVDVKDPDVDGLTCSIDDVAVLPVDGLYTIPAGKTLDCVGTTVYTERENTVDVDVYDSGVITSTASDTATATGEVVVVDNCVDLADTLYSDPVDREVCGVNVADGPVEVQTAAIFDEDACGSHSVSNTATLTDKGDTQIATETVDVEYTVTCDVMDVSKSGEIVGSEVWTWTVDKNIDLENQVEDDLAVLEIAQGSTVLGDYEIILHATSERVDAAVEWLVTITNPRSTPEIIDINDPLLGALSCTDEDGVAVPAADDTGYYPIAAKQTLTCTGESPYGEQSNSVTVTVVGESEGGQASADATGELDVIDGCVSFTDSAYDHLNDNKICADELTDGNYIIPLNDVAFGSDVCGDHSKVNTASIVGDDGTNFGSNTVTVNYEVVCGAITVNKSGVLSGDTTWTWSVDKSIDLDGSDADGNDADGKVELSLNQGYPATGTYTIDVTGEAATTGQVVWTVEVENPRVAPITVSVMDAVALTCKIGDDPAPVADGLYTIAADSTMICTGTSDHDATSNTVTVNVYDGVDLVETIDKDASAIGELDVINGCVQFADSVYDGLNQEICGDKHLDEDGLRQIMKAGVTFGADVCGSHEVVNTASLTNGDMSKTDSVAVGYTVECGEVSASKSGTISGDVVWTWEVDKSVDLDGSPIDRNADEGMVEFPMSQGSTMLANYTVDLSASSEVVDSQVDWVVEVTNPRRSAVTVMVTDEVELDCSIDGNSVTPVDGLYTIPAESTLHCEGATAADVTTNTATVKVVEDGKVVSTISPQADAEPELGEVDRCVNLTDSLYPELNDRICVGDLIDGKRSFEVAGIVTANASCNTDMKTENTAAATGTDSGDAVSDTVTITNRIECEFNGCTRTRGYWRTHSDSDYAGSAYKADSTWELVGGADAEFLESGLTYYQILSAPVRGDKWLTLAQQYIAAELNVLAEADGSAVSDEMDAALDLLSSNDPGSLGKKQRREAVDLAQTLDAYNNGYIGPGHCG